jgi:hypothetical protein
MNMNKGHAFFPIEWNFGDKLSDGLSGPPIADPSIIFVHGEHGADEPEECFWFSLREMIDDLIDGSISTSPDGKTTKIEGEQAQIAIAVRDCLRALADKLDTVIQ